MSEGTEVTEVDLGATAAEMETGGESMTETEMETARGETTKTNRLKAKGSKRRAPESSPTEQQILKRQNSLPDLKEAGLKYPKTFSDMIVKSFEDENCVRILTPILGNIVTPLINNAMEGAADRACNKMKANMFDALLEAQKDLQEMLCAQSEIIKTQNSKIEDQQKAISENEKEISSLKNDVKTLSSELQKLQLQTNNLEQYGRRNSIRLDNYPRESSEKENTESIVKFLNSKLLSPTEKIQCTDIERCHPIGPRGENGKGQLIVKFKSYHTKQKVFSNKKKLKNVPGRIFMSEDLTKANHAIVKTLVMLKKARKVDSFWTNNGTDFAKKQPGDVPMRVRSETEAISTFES